MRQDKRLSSKSSTGQVSPQRCSQTLLVRKTRAKRRSRNVFEVIEDCHSISHWARLKFDYFALLHDVRHVPVCDMRMGTLLSNLVFPALNRVVVCLFLFSCFFFCFVLYTFVQLKQHVLTPCKVFCEQVVHSNEGSSSYEIRNEYSTSYTKDTRAELLEAWLALTSVKYHGNLLILMLLNQWLALTMLRTTGSRGLSRCKETCQDFCLVAPSESSCSRHGVEL